MDVFRKYFDQKQLLKLHDAQPDWGVTVRTVGHYIHRPKMAYPDNSHPDSYYFDWKKGRVLEEFQLIYISHGYGLFEAEGVAETIIEPGTAFLLFPNVWHRYRPSEETGWEEFWVGYEGHYAEYLMKQDCFKPSFPFVAIGFNAEILNVFIQLIETVKHESKAFNQISSCLVTQLLALVYSSAIITDDRQKRNQIIYTARFKIHENFNNSIDMALLADELNVSYSWLRKAFKEVLGNSPGQYHLNIRLEKACKFLKETDLTVSQISGQLGFESEFYFSRIFKKKIGKPPGAFRISKNK